MNAALKALCTAAQRPDAPAFRGLWLEPEAVASLQREVEAYIDEERRHFEETERAAPDGTPHLFEDLMDLAWVVESLADRPWVVRTKDADHREALADPNAYVFAPTLVEACAAAWMRFQEDSDYGQTVTEVSDFEL